MKGGCSLKNPYDVFHDTTELLQCMEFLEGLWPSLGYVTVVHQRLNTSLQQWQSIQMGSLENIAFLFSLRKAILLYLLMELIFELSVKCLIVCSSILYHYDRATNDTPMLATLLSLFL